MKNDLPSVTNQQREIINSNSQVIRVIACAGSGKTKTIVKKIAKTINEGLASPKEIITITYTEKSAQELLVRISSSIKHNKLHEMFIGTIHAYCLDTLQRHVCQYKMYNLLNDVSLVSFIENNQDKLQINENIPAHDTIKKYIDAVFWLDEQPKTTKNETFEMLLSIYHDLLDKNKCFTYSTILTKFLELLDNDWFCQIIKNSIKYLYVDEYQDVNFVLDQIVRKFVSLGINVCVVGDDDQAIYQFRGASNKYILDFDKGTNAKTYYLSTNFRSSTNVVDLANEFIKQNNGRRIDKPLLSNNKHIGSNNDIQIQSFKNQEDEVENIAKKIDELNNLGIRYKDIAILCRTNNQLNKIAKILKTNYQSIPFIKNDLASLFSKETPPISKTDCIKNIFLLIDNPFISQSALDELINQTLNMFKCQKLEVAYALKQKITSFKKSLEQCKIKFINIQEFYLDILSLLIHDIDDDNNLIELAKISQIINKFEDTPAPHDLPNKKFHSLVELLKQIQKNATSYTIDEKQEFVQFNAINLLTVHSAKGLEFSAIFIPFVHDDEFPALKSLTREVSNSLIKKRNKKDDIWEDNLSGEKSKNYDFFINLGKYPKDFYENLATRQEFKQKRICDERNLFYVALTRAKQYIFMSYHKKPSEFIDSKIFNKFVINNNEKLNKTYEWVLPNTVPTPVLNYSIIDKFLDCPYRFKLEDCYQFCSPIKQSDGYGVAVHNCIELIINKLKNEPKLQNNINAVIDEVVESLHLKHALSNDESIKQARRELCNNHMIELFKSSSFLQTERKFLLQINNVDVLVSGRIDLIKQQNNKTTIIDFKTTKYIDVNKAVSTLQLPIYALGLKACTNKTVDEGYIYNLTTGQLSSFINLSKINAHEIEQQIACIVSDLKNNHFIKNTVNCLDCKWNKICQTKTI